MEKEKLPSPEIEDEIETPDAVSQVVPDDLETKPDEKPEPKPEPKVPDVSKLNNTIAYQNRKLEQAMRELKETREQIAALRQAPVQEPESQDEIDKIANQDWKLGVQKLVEKQIETKIQETLDKKEKAQAELNRRQTLESELDKSKQKVLQKYPQIEEEGSEESNFYRQVLNEDPSILSNVHGPEIAMYRMEEKMRESGVIPSGVKPVVDREVQRQVRAGASSVVGRTASPNGKITLTNDQKKFCDHHNIPYEQYAKNLKSGDFKEGVEV